MSKILPAFVAALVLFTVYIFTIGAPARANDDDLPLPEQAPITISLPTVTVEIPVPRLTIRTRTVTVEVPVPTIVPPTLLPRVTVTDIVRLPGATQTIRMPGQPGMTETVRQLQTVTVRPNGVTVGGPTVTARETATANGPVVTESNEVTAVTTATTGQTPTPTAIIDPGESEDSPSVNFPGLEFDSPAEAVALTTAAVLALVGLVLLGLYFGYALGWKDRERKEKDFLAALRDMRPTKGKN